MASQFAKVDENRISIGNCMVLSAIRDLSSTRKYFEVNLTEQVQWVQFVAFEIFSSAG